MTESLGRYIPKLRRRDGDDCGLCGMPVDFALRYPDPMSASVDHILPKSLGGRTTPSNLRLAHQSCNHERGAGWNRKRRKTRVPVAECM